MVQTPFTPPKPQQQAQQPNAARQLLMSGASSAYAAPKPSAAPASQWQAKPGLAQAQPYQQHSPQQPQQHPAFMGGGQSAQAQPYQQQSGQMNQGPSFSAVYAAGNNGLGPAGRSTGTAYGQGGGPQQSMVMNYGGQRQPHQQPSMGQQGHPAFMGGVQQNARPQQGGMGGWSQQQQMQQRQQMPRRY